MENPPNRSIIDPAVETALSRIWTRNPNPAPARAWTTSAPMRVGVSKVVVPSWALSWGTMAIARAAARPARTVRGMERWLKGGATASQAPALTMASRNARYESVAIVTGLQLPDEINRGIMANSWSVNPTTWP